MENVAHGLLARPWAELERLKARHWAERKRERGLGEGLRVGAELRAHVLAQNPNWPSASERQQDIDTHVRVGDWLRRVGTISAR